MPELLPFTVVVVDDDPSIRRLVKLLLKRSHYAVLECAMGEEARVTLQEKPWDLAILDRRLPDIDGVVLCQEIKADSAIKNRYVIMLTGEDDQRDKIEGLDLGADDYITKPFQPGEFLARIRAGKRIVDLQKELIASNKRLELLSITDGLTKLYNHRHFQDELARQFDEAVRYQRPLSLALIDLDFFKKINDTYGHAAGDTVLQDVSAIFAGSVRSSDLAARYGGEEFIVMMPETDLEDAVTFAEKIRVMVGEKPITTAAGEVPVTVSIGVSSYPFSRLKTPRELIDAADKALYRAKRNGRNQVQAERRIEGQTRKTRVKAS
ncbi:MAG TPA: diguanylate cyclase [Thermoanaerobaculia bacterium]|nr:diguanylate cyclase [Thermoanaerobaculia bacterium]